MFKKLAVTAASAAMSLSFMAFPVAAVASDGGDPFTFDMVVSAGAKGCVPNASAEVDHHARRAC